jgi:hypothetical protein
MQQHECVEPELLVFGMANPSEFAVFWLITISNLVGCKTGRSAGFAPRPPADPHPRRHPGARTLIVRARA